MVVRHWRNSKALKDVTPTAQHEKEYTPQEGVAAVSEQARFLLCIPDQPECFAVLIGGCIKLRMHGQMSYTLCACQAPSGQPLLLPCCNQMTSDTVLRHDAHSLAKWEKCQGRKRMVEHLLIRHVTVSPQLVKQELGWLL